MKSVMPNNPRVEQTSLLPTAVPHTLPTTWIIARRAALESLHDRATLAVSGFFALALPTILALAVIAPQAAHSVGAKKESELGATIALYLLIVGLGPSSGAISIASGVFAGEMEKGNLAPLLATPASNVAIFGGKVLGAVLPALIYATVAITTYVLEIILVSGPDMMRLLPLSLALATVLLVPAVTVLGATVASLISSRVRTYTGAQTVASLTLVPIMGALIGLGAIMRYWGPWWPFAVVAGVYVVDLLLVLRSAASWRREEVLARR